MKRLAGLLLTATALILLTGCSGGGGQATTPTPAPSAPSAPGTAAASPSPVVPPTVTGSSTPTSTSTAVVPGANCLTGTWRLVRFVGLGEQSTYGTGQGGDVTVAFDNGRYNLLGKGQRPITVNLAGESAQLTVDGTVEGAYQPDGADMSFTITKATGEGTLQSGNQRQTLPMSSIGQVIAPQGKATLACPDNVLLVALPTVRLEFER
ncbi:MAG TPA: hypothetical protein VE617_06250 [Propionibacteriaceae bacterium]|nr:hypothetical protein [Propionibacteriaceae bacterium]